MSHVPITMRSMLYNCANSRVPEVSRWSSPISGSCLKTRIIVRQESSVGEITSIPSSHWMGAFRQFCPEMRAWSKVGADWAVFPSMRGHSPSFREPRPTRFSLWGLRKIKSSSNATDNLWRNWTSLIWACWKLSWVAIVRFRIGV